MTTKGWGSVLLGAVMMLGIVSWGQASSTDVFQSIDIELAAGPNEIETPAQWNAVSLFTLDGSPLPALTVRNDRGTWAKWDMAHSHGVPIVDTTDMLTYSEPQSLLAVQSDEAQTVKAHFFFIPEEERVETQSGTISSDAALRPRFVSRNEWLRGMDSDESATLDIWEQTRAIEQSASVRVQAKLVQPEDDLYKEDLDDESELFRIDGENDLPRITVHHTVTPMARIYDPYATVRGIYNYHAFTRGWGDIGYHYLISPDGLIFEGSADGPTKSGTHVANRNFNNIGISLMGDFQNGDKPTDAQIEVLSLLIADHAIRFGITPSEVSNYFGVPVQRVSGHRDIASRSFGTACPGDDLHRQLPEIRERAEHIIQLIQGGSMNPITTRDRLQHSSIAPDIQGRRVKLGQERAMPITMQRQANKPTLRRDVKGTLEVRVKNNTKTTWNEGVKLLTEGTPEGMLLTDFVLVRATEPDTEGVFRAKYLVKTTQNGIYGITLNQDFLDQTDAFADRQQPLRMSFTVSGDLDFLLQAQREMETPDRVVAVAPTLTPATEPEIKIKIEFFKQRYADVIGSSEVQVFVDDAYANTAPAGEPIKVIPLWSEEENRTRMQVSWGDELMSGGDVKLVTSDADGHLTIKNYDRGLGASHAYNAFRRQLNFHVSGRERMIAVNQLPIRLYMRGLSEQPAGTPLEKHKAIHVLAQSYAYVYSQTDKRKFDTDLYDLNDDPASSQYYLGYIWEKYHADRIGLLEHTEGEVITVDGVPVIGPYYSCSGGQSSAKWRSAYPHTQAQSLPYDLGCTAAGHGVGLSGYTTLKMAEAGYDYEEILDFFYNGIEIEKVY